MQTKYMADMTAHPELFEHTRWGQLPSVLRSMLGGDDIVENRNAFVHQYGVMMHIPNIHDIIVIPPLCDSLGPLNQHAELYRNQDGHLVLVVSPHTPDGEMHPTLPGAVQEVGFTEIPGIYDCTCLSYAAVFKNGDEIMNAWQKIVTASKRKLHEQFNECRTTHECRTPEGAVPVQGRANTSIVKVNKDGRIRLSHKILKALSSSPKSETFKVERDNDEIVVQTA